MDYKEAIWMKRIPYLTKVIDKELNGKILAPANVVRKEMAGLSQDNRDVLLDCFEAFYKFLCNKEMTGESIKRTEKIIEIIKEVSANESK